MIRKFVFCDPYRSVKHKLNDCVLSFWQENDCTIATAKIQK